MGGPTSRHLPALGRPDLVVALSRDLGATVAGAGADRQRRLLVPRGHRWRCAPGYSNSYDAVSEPFDRGNPSPTEADAPLEDLDGDGIMAALADVGFNVATWSGQGPWRALSYTGTGSRRCRRQQSPA